MRNKIRILMIMIVILAIPRVVLADSDISFDNASALNEITILRGDGIDYNLSGQLKRSEAVAFLVRLLGIENKVIEDKERYITNDYVDVDPSCWYSYYIGYVTSGGIVTGFNDGTFKPEQYVTEKEFTKMILSTINYRQGIDYEWDDIYDFSYSIGLYDKTYVNKEDNIDYTREDAISLMYNALKMKINKLDKTLTEKLIDKNVFTVEQAINAGIIEDTIKTDIIALDVLDDKNMRISLSEQVKEFDKDNIVIYEVDNESKELDIEVIEFSKNIITITTDEQETGVDYAIKLLETEDLEGYKTLDIEKYFKGYIDDSIESNYFKVSKVKAISKNVINVYYTQPINMRAIQYKSYTIKKGKDVVAEGDRDDIGISLLGDVNNGISIFLRNYDLEDGVEYSIEIDGDLSSLYSIDLNEGDGEEVSFIGNTIPNKEFDVDNIEIIDNHYIIVTYNKDVDKYSATRSSNYELVDKHDHSRRAVDSAMIGYGQDKYRKVKLKFSNITENEEYELVINDVEDSYEQMDIEDSFPLYSYMDEEIKTGVDYAYAENQNTLNVYFNKVIPGIKSAKFNINGVSIKTVKYDKSEPDKITIYTNESSKLEEGIEYELKIHNAKDEFGKAYNDIEYTFQGTSEEFYEIGIDECKFISDNKVYVEFDSDINYSNSIVSKFELEYEKSDRTKKIPAKDIYQISDRIVIVRFSDINDSTEYRLNIDNLQDYSKQFTSRDVSRSVEW